MLDSGEICELFTYVSFLTLKSYVNHSKLC
jgi:hypothetical protein